MTYNIQTTLYEITENYKTYAVPFKLLYGLKKSCLRGGDKYAVYHWFNELNEDDKSLCTIK